MSIPCTEEAYMAVSDLAKLRMIGRLMTELHNRAAILESGQSVFVEIERLQALIDTSGKSGP